VNVPKDLRFLRYLLLKLFTARPVPKGKQDKPRRDWSCYRSSSADGSGLIESIYERCTVRELELRSIPAATQQLVRIQYKGIVFDEPLRFDILVDSCLLLQLKAVEALHPFSKAQLFSYMKVVDVPVGLLINFHQPVLRNGTSRLILPGENQMEGNEVSV
jgi:GxxExxY protein